jgi:hypothetical protein
VRYETYDPILNFYNEHKNAGYADLRKAEGYQTDPETRLHKWLAVYIKKLEKLGYKHRTAATAVTGGDNDYLVIDHEKKEFCLWKVGFGPFFSYLAARDLPQTHDLEYWANHRN